VPQELIAKYTAGGNSKREACTALLDLIYKSILGVTVCAPSYEQLSTIWAIRRLYQPSGLKLSVDDKLELSRRFEAGYEKLKDEPRVAELKIRVESYQRQLKYHSLSDHQVSATNTGGRRALFLLLWRLVMLTFFAIVSLPGAILNLPIIVLSRTVAIKKAAEAKRDSSVKIAGRDVMATWKVMVASALLPLCFIIYPAVAAFVGYWMEWGALRTWFWFALFQLPIMYGAVRFIEVGFDIFRSLKPLLMSLRHKAKGRNLRQERTELKECIRKLVDDFGPKMMGQDFDKKRLISPDTFRRLSMSYAGDDHAPPLEL